MRSRRFINNNLNYKTMPKVKTNSGAKKRFSFTGTGKIKRHHAYHSHILTKKTKKQKRNLCGSTLVDVTNMKQVRDLLCLR
jgi:large subunit ribosomal protein L35